jgi:hypothetical protein
MNTETPAPPLTHVELAVTTGTPDKAGVGPGRKFQISVRGVRFRGKMTYEQWMDGLRMLKTVREGWDFAYADFLRYGRTEFGDEQVNEAVKQLEFDLLDTVRAYRIGQIEFDFRSPVLGAEHYYVLGDLNEPDRTRWAGLAEREQLTPLELKKSIEAGRIVRQETVNTESGRGAGITNVQSLRVWFSRWETQAGGHQQILSWPAEEKKKWLDEVSPIVTLAREIEASLGEGIK